MPSTAPPLPDDARDPVFRVTASDPNSRARAGRLFLPHGTVETPAFMPVGTLATVKGLSFDRLINLDYRLILANTYHLYLRPGTSTIAAAGGIHAFAGWPGNVLTDSGGYQVFSLAGLRDIHDWGVRFRSHVDGSVHEFTPRVVMDAQRDIASDIAMAFDECPPSTEPRETVARACARTSTWLGECVEAWNDNGRRTCSGSNQALFGIVQGGTDHDLRAASADSVCSTDVTGIAVGGLAVGETAVVRKAVLDDLVPRLDRSRPSYLMGVGTPLDLLDGIARGIDMFDCVLPTRNGRNGQIFTGRGPVNLRNASHARDFSPPEDGCACDVCTTHSRAYLHHLFRSREMLGPQMATWHNLHFYATLMSNARAAIVNGTFAEVAQRHASTYTRRQENRGDSRNCRPDE